MRRNPISKEEILEKGVELNRAHDIYKRTKTDSEKKKAWKDFKLLNTEYHRLFDKYLSYGGDISGLL